MGYTTVAIILLIFIVMLAISNWILWRRFSEIRKYLLYILKVLRAIMAIGEPIKKEEEVTKAGDKGAEKKS